MGDVEEGVDEPLADRSAMLIREATLEDLVAEIRSRVGVSVLSMLTKDGRRFNYSQGDGIMVLGLVTWATMCVHRRIDMQDKGDNPDDE